MPSKRKGKSKRGKGLLDSIISNIPVVGNVHNTLKSTKVLSKLNTLLKKGSDII